MLGVDVEAVTKMDQSMLFVTVIWLWYKYLSETSWQGLSRITNLDTYPNQNPQGCLYGHFRQAIEILCLITKCDINKPQKRDVSFQKIFERKLMTIY